MASRNRIAQVPWLVGGLAILAVVFFDLGPPLAFNDDWLYAGSARHFGLSGPQVPFDGALALVQGYWAAIFSLGRFDQRLLRLSVVPFVLMSAYYSYRLARALGADIFWSRIAAISLLTTPTFLNLATSFMTDVPYIALLLAASESAVKWIQNGQGRFRCLIWAVLSTLQRQLGIGLAAALTVALILKFRHQRPVRNDVIYLGALWALLLAIQFLGLALGRTPSSHYGFIADPTHLDLAHIGDAVTYLSPSLGLALAPFLLAVVSQKRAAAHGIPIVPAIAILFGVAGLIVAINHLVLAHAVFPGNIWVQVGLAPTSIGGAKPILYPDALWFTVEVVAVMTAAAVTVVGWHIWQPVALGAGGTFLLVMAVTQFLPLLAPTVQTFDRYDLVPAALLVPVAAAAASRTTMPRLSAGWALAIACCGGLLYAAGQQDYGAWQTARDQAARMAYTRLPAEDVHAGLEANAVYVVVPLYQRDGHLRVVGGRTPTDFMIFGPAQPKLSLEYAGPDDPRSGVSYWSLAPGRIVLQGR